MAELQCDSLEGLAFAVTYYLDNQPQGTDVLRFHDHRMGCDGCEEHGLLAGAFSCKPDKPGSLTASAFMVTDSTMMRRYLFTLTRAMIYGRVDLRNKDASFTTESFEGKPAPATTTRGGM